MIAPDDGSVGEAIRLAAQAHTAIQVLASPGGPWECRLGNRVLVAPGPLSSPEHAHAGNWIDGWRLSVISRQADLLDRLLALRPHVFSQPPIHAPEVTLQWVDLYAAVLTAPDILQHPAYAWLREYVATCPPQGAHGKAVKSLSGPQLDLLPPLARRDPAGFEATLVRALQQHQKYWSATEKRRKDPEGFVALDLTAIAALAWDRGLRFEADSDYLPWSWVTGDLFREAAKA